MPLADRLWELEGGYCLWVGAGLSRQVAAHRADVPLWDQLTDEMEAAAGLQAVDDQDFPSRLDACMRELGEEQFTAFLRDRYYTQLCAGLLSQAAGSLAEDELVPDHVRAVAGLGQLANPIVSFNVESLSSLLLARPAGPIRILSQRPKAGPSHRWQELTDRFHRIVYHPHGLAIGDSVMTSSQYADMQQELTFTLAIHAAFGNTLVIVGMSLNDDHLRRQIEEYRPSLGKVYWFDSQFPPHLAAWAENLDIDAVEVDWPEFWGFWLRSEINIAPHDLLVAWYMAVSEAAEEAQGGALGGLQRLIDELPEGATPDGLTRIAAETDAAARELGEPGTPLMAGGIDSRTIEMAVRSRLIEEGIPMPRVARTYAPDGRP